MPNTSAVLFGLAPTLPSTVRNYFGPDAEHPVVEDIFVAGKGWRPRRSRLELTQNMVDAFAEAGVTLVTLRSGNRTASFRIEHLRFE